MRHLHLTTNESKDINTFAYLLTNGQDKIYYSNRVFDKVLSYANNAIIELRFSGCPCELIIH